MRRAYRWQTFSLVPVAMVLVIAACAPAAPAGPTPAPPAPAAAPAKVDTKAEQKAAPTAAPAKPVAQPTAKPAAPTAAPAQQPAAKPADNFFAGKTIRVIVGFAPGGQYDLWARILSRHMPKYIPGNPTMVVENMPGAASALVANQLYNTAPKDGTVFGTIASGLLAQQVLGREGIQFDMQKFNWLGAISEPTTVCIATEASGVRSFEDLLPPKRTQVNFGGSAPGSVSDDFPTMFNTMLNTNIKLVTGYGGLGPVRLAIQQGELDGYCAAWSSSKTQHRPWLEAGQPKFQYIVQMGMRKNPELPDVPNAYELLQSDEDRAVMKMVIGQVEFVFPFLAPPGVPAERVALLRKAVADTFKDQDLLAEAKKAELDVVPLTGEQVEQLQRDLLGAPKPVLDRYRQLLGG